MALLTLAAIAMADGAASAQQDHLLPDQGVVPDAATAVKIARAVLTAWKGETEVQLEEPLTAQLKDNDTWIVRGTMPRGFLGGVGEVEIAKSDGRILRLFHGQ